MCLSSLSLFILEVSIYKSLESDTNIIQVLHKFHNNVHLQEEITIDYSYIMDV